jgi:serine/threonine protein kinase/streptogramin lyase
MPDLGEGSVFAGHRIEGVAGRGGMGTVYRATHIALDHMVALKVIAADLADDGSFRERFRLESRIAVSLRHPNVVPIHDAGEEDGLLFVTMDLIDGPDLRKLLTYRGPLEPAPAVAILEQVAAALDVAHSRGLVHRDIKPGNVLIEDRGGTDHAYLTDFGLTKRIGQPSAASALTSTGAFVGTLDYVAPEQIRGEHLDARTDVYALGCVLYEVLVCRPPFAEREEKVAKMYAHLQDQPEPLTGRAAPLAEIVERAMAKERDDRFPSAGDMARAARAALEGGEVAEAERSVARGPAAPTEAYETPRELVAPMPGASELDPTVESELPPAATVGSEAPVAATVESESPLEPGPPTAADPEPAPASARPRQSPPLKLIGGGLAAAVIAVVAIVVLGGGSGDGGGGGSSGPVAVGTAGDSITVPEFPVGVAVGAGEVRVATRDAGQLVQVEEGAAEGTPVALGVGTAEDVVFAAGSWWATSPDSGAVVRVGGDGSLQEIAIPGGPTGIAAQGSKAVWVTNSDSNQLTRIEIGSDGSGSAAAPIILGEASRPHGVAFGAGALWITSRDNDKLIRVDLDDTSEQRSLGVGPNPKGVTVAADGAVWVANAGKAGDGSVMRVGAGSDQPELVAGLSGTMRDVVEGSEGTIWASDGQGSVAAIDPESVELIDELEVPNSEPEDLAFGRGRLWVTGGKSNVVTPIEPADLSG